MLCERIELQYRMSIVYLNLFFFFHIELPLLKGDFAEEGIMCMMLGGSLHGTE